MSSIVRLAAVQHGDQLAFDDGDVQITYAELESCAIKSPAMKAIQLQPAARVAWCPGNDTDAFLTFWALQICGCVACPISHRFPDPTREAIVRRIKAVWLDSLPNRNNGSAEILLDTGSHEEVDDHPATIILSSGSTGVPKAVFHSMQSHVNSARSAAINMPVAPGDRWLWSLPLFHVSGLSIVVRCALAGATVVGMAQGQSVTASFLDKSRITHLSVVSAQLRRLLNEEGFPSKHLKYVLLGGSGVDPKLVRTARERGVPVCTTYGMTEMGSQITTSRTDDDPAKSGRLLSGKEMKISPEGEILVRGDSLCAGYYQAGSVRPVVDEEGWFHTRDRGRLDDGQLLVLGRMDNMFISGGENIYPEAIERAMMNSFDISQAVVVPKPDFEFGFRPVVFVDGTLPDDWKSQLGSMLQRYEIPIKIFEWPSSVDGMIKPDRKRLQELVVD